jgi:Zn finger protein HypA/HybF involved in hydrogenase expression
MHEASLMAGLMRRIGMLAAQDGAKRIVSVSVRLGALSGISAAHFADHFASTAKGTAAEHARLHIEVAEGIGDPNVGDILLESVEIET